MASDEPKATLYDFLYIDNDRVKSLYSQLFSGLLNAIETVASQSTAKSTDFKLGSPHIAAGGRRYETKNTETSLENIDPHDLILRDVLQGLAEQGIIHGNPSQAEPGNIVLLNGSLTILNFEAYRHILAMMPNIVPVHGVADSPTYKKQRKHLEREGKKQQDNLHAILKGISDIVPWGLQVILDAGEIIAWGALRSQNLREAPGNLTLKVGPTLAGTWFMLGIVDVIGPLRAEPPNNLSPHITGLMEACSAIRNFFGRPDDHIGLTPLLIFRKLN